MALLNGINVPFIPLSGVEFKKNREKSSKIIKSDSIFGQIFSDELIKINYSPETTALIESEELNLSEDELQKINRALILGKENNLQKLVAVIGESAFTLNVDNDSLETVAKWNEGDEKLITGIDSVVFFEKKEI